MDNKKIVSIIIPIFNEEKNIPSFLVALKEIIKPLDYNFEIIFVNDGSRDNSQLELEKIIDEQVKVIEFSRNFGKEIALTAGLNNCLGDSALMIDADFQHPLEFIPEFIKKWENGAEVVIGIREKNNCGPIKHVGSFLFYKIIKKISSVNITPNSTDFRLLDRQVIDAFNGLSEKNRMTRALIDWLGFKREYIYFNSPERINGKASYNFFKLVNLAFNGFVSLSLFPLRLAGYLGLLIIFFDGFFGLYVFLGKYLFHWAFASSFTGSAQLAILITFLVGIVLTSLGLMALYIANIHHEVLDRPLYVVRKNK